MKINKFSKYVNNIGKQSFSSTWFYKYNNSHLAEQLLELLCLNYNYKMYVYYFLLDNIWNKHVFYALVTGLFYENQYQNYYNVTIYTNNT